MNSSKKFFIHKFLIWGLTIFILIVFMPFAYSQENPPSVNKATAVSKIDGTPVVLEDQTLFVVKAGVGSFSAEERAHAVTNRIEIMAKDLTVPVNSLRVSNLPNTTNILSGDKVILTITDDDVKATDKTRQELANEYVQKISSNITKYRQEHSVTNLLFGLLYTFISTIVLLIILSVLNQILKNIFNKVSNWQGRSIPNVRFQNFEILPASRITYILNNIIRVIRLVLVLGILYIYIPLILSFFPWTRQISKNLFNYLFLGIESAVQELVAYLPKLIALAIIII
ncbi:MAG: mechanosensitive ion channel family protein, partial [Rhizonema sp. PD37]|nr:mechanosensitive ion channel family protein [Rhizonema sp. PD37]